RCALQPVLRATADRAIRPAGPRRCCSLSAGSSAVLPDILLKEEQAREAARDQSAPSRGHTPTLRPSTHRTDPVCHWPAEAWALTYRFLHLRFVELPELDTETIERWPAQKPQP